MIDNTPLQLPLNSVGRDLTLDSLNVKNLNVATNILLNNAQFLGPRGDPGTAGTAGVDGIVPPNGSVTGLNVVQPYNTVTAGRIATCTISGNGNSGGNTFTTTANTFQGSQSYSSYILSLINGGVNVLSVSLGASNNIIVYVSRNQNVSEINKTFTSAVFNTTDSILRAALGMKSDGSFGGVTSTGLTNNTSGTPWVASWTWTFPNPTLISLGNNVLGDLNVTGTIFPKAISIPPNSCFTRFNSQVNANIPAPNTNTSLNLNGAFTNSAAFGVASGISFPAVGLYRMDVTFFLTFTGSGTFGDSGATMLCSITNNGSYNISMERRNLCSMNYNNILNVSTSGEFLVTNTTNSNIVLNVNLITSNTGVTYSAYAFGTIRLVNSAT